MKNSVNIINLSQIEELSNEQTMNIFGGSSNFNFTAETRQTPGGSPTGTIPGIWDPPATDKTKSPHTTFFTY